MKERLLIVLTVLLVISGKATCEVGKLNSRFMYDAASAIFLTSNSLATSHGVISESVCFFLRL